MKLFLWISLSVIFGYLAGSMFPLENVVNPYTSVRLANDLTLKKGTVGRTRFFKVESSVNMPIEFEIDQAIPEGAIERIKN